ncbi:putative Ig domain-containing protein [Roseiarcaceae bacterium H3SJ34-1]|uniref:putative Ig domain-containing protein n=1 Tax=Terripilifer ovatus TaxID=3032367 RepID=UPI003AB94E3D|nr:putative Ig domain-containing protein [Roseiarcaceae bacterium H3SJ34-1]
MVAIVAGSGRGLLDTSLDTLGPQGGVGQAGLGQGQAQAFVNVANGNLVLQAQDAQLAGRGEDLLAARNYNSLAATFGGEESGWRWSVDQSVEFKGPGTPAHPGSGATIARINGDGHETSYQWDMALGIFASTEGGGAYDELRYDGAATEWVWTEGATRVTERYTNSTGPNDKGRLLRRADPGGNSIDFGYEGGLLTTISDTASRQQLRLLPGPAGDAFRPQGIEARALVDDADGHATATLGNPQRLIDYAYDANGRLTSVIRYLDTAGGVTTGSAAFVTNYAYDGASTRITGMTQGDGAALGFAYDAAGRVVTVNDGAAAPGIALSLAYDTPHGSAVVTDGVGQAWTCRYEPATGQLTEIAAPLVDGPPISTRFAYDAQGNLIAVAGPGAQARTLGYDTAGNPTFERTATGDTTARSFDARNQVLTETRYRIADPDGDGPGLPADPATTRYAYDAASRLRFVVSPEGRVRESRYGSDDGLLAQTLTYAGTRYDVDGLDPAQSLSEAQLTAWVQGLADKAQIEITAYDHDLRGNVSRKTRFATVGVDGAGVLDAQAWIEELSCDAASLQRQRIAVRGAARDQRAVLADATYDGMARVTRSTAADGHQTTQFDDANSRIVTTMASGLMVTRTFDGRGRLLTLDQSDGAVVRRTRYAYDDADRLRMIEDPEGGRRYRFHDAAGRLEWQVDATGAVTRFERDAAGQILRQTLYANRAGTTGWYDEATGKVVKNTLSTGGPGSDVIVDAAHDRVTVHAYDEAGRRTETTDALGTVTHYRYDGLSRLVMTQTADRATRFLYDRDGNQVGVIDPLGYLTERTFNAAGRLVETVRYSRRSVAMADVSAPAWIGVTDQFVTGGQRLRYRLPSYDADGDATTVAVIGSVPAWLSFDAATTTLSGTPPVADVIDTITLRADDGRGGVSDITVRLVVSAAAPMSGLPGGPAWPALPPLDAVAGAAVSYAVAPAAGASLTYAVLGGLPTGMLFDGAALTITGSCAHAGCYSIALRVTDATGRSTDRTVSVRISPVVSAALQPLGSDQMSAWRPAGDPDALRSYAFYDGQGRVIGAVDEQQFLTETVYDESLNTRRTLRYLTPVAVAAGDDLTALRGRAGAALQLSLVSFDDFGRVRENIGPDGSTVTRYTYDAAGRLILVAAAADTVDERSGSTFYNAFGEVIATLGGEGTAALGTSPTPAQVEAMIDGYGVRYTCDTLGRVIRRVDAGGSLTLFYYDRENRRTHTIGVIGSATDGSLAGEVSETNVNAFGEPEIARRYAARIDNAGMTTLLADGGGGTAGQALFNILAPLVDASRDQVSRYEYDGCGRVTKATDGENGITETLYNVFGEPAAQVHSIADGQSTTRQFDRDLAGRVIAETGDTGGINACTSTGYDAFGRVIGTVDAAGLASLRTYPDNGRSVVETDRLGSVTRTDLDALGRRVLLSDALGQQTRFAYDEAARSTTATTPEGLLLVTRKTPHGETASITDARGNVTRYAFNRDGQPVSTIDALGQPVERISYDNSGRKLETTDARGTVTRFGYDQRNRLIEQRIDPAGLNLTTRFVFDALGRKVAETRGAGTTAAQLTTHAYDRKGREIRAVVDAAEGGLQLCTTYGYDARDNVVRLARGSVPQPDQQVTLYTFDNLGRRTGEIAAPSAVFGAGAAGTRDLTTLYRYDVCGRLSRRIGANSASTWYVQDAEGRRTHEISALGEVSESRYDRCGRLVYNRAFLTRLGSAQVAAFGDVVTAAPLPAALPNDRQSHTVYDRDGHICFSLKSADANGWTITESRFDSNGNMVEARAYDKFLPDARVAALAPPAGSGIDVAALRQELSTTLGYHDGDPATLAGVQRSSFVYDADNRLHFSVDASGSVGEVIRDGAGNTIATVAFAARPVLADHTEAAIDAAVDRGNPDNRVTHTAYDAAGRRRFMVDPLGAVIEDRFDVRSNIVTSMRWATRPALTDFSESAIAAALAAMPASGCDQITKQVYDFGDRLRFTIDPLGAVSETLRDALGNLVAETHFAERPAAIPDYTVDAVAAAVQPLRGDAANQIRRFAYDPVQRQRFTVDALGSLAENVYDATGKLLATTSYAARPVLTQFDETAIAGAAAPLAGDTRNRVTRFAYDAQGRQRFTVDALGSVSERVLDAQGSVTRSERFAVRPALTTYSEAAIDTAVAGLRGQPGNRLDHQLYDALGRVRHRLSRITATPGADAYSVTSAALNALGQTMSATAYAGAVILASIDEAAIAAAVSSDPERDRVLRFAYDVLGQQLYRVQAVSTDAGESTYRVSAQRFDALGQMTGRTDHAATVKPNAFDAGTIAAAVEAIADSARDRITATVYDPAGQAVYGLRQLQPGAWQANAQAYDALGRVVATTRYAKLIGPLPDMRRAAVAAALAANADAADRKTCLVQDQAGRQRFVLQADAIGSWTLGESRYDLFGNLVETRRYDRYLTDAWIASLVPTRPDGLTEADMTGELASLGYEDNAPASLAGLQRSRFAYDGLNRLRFTVDALGGVTENTYDALGDKVSTVRYAARPVLAALSEAAIDTAVNRADADNQARWFVYDAIGQQRFDLQVMTPNATAGDQHRASEMRYDALGQFVESRAYATLVGPLAAYDEATVAAAIVADLANDRHSAVAYDAGGRQVFALRELQGVPASTYVVTRQVQDALGQAVQQVVFATPVAPAQLGAAGIEAALAPSPAGDRTTSYVRDAAGRQRFEIRPDSSFLESCFDALDQLLEQRLFDFRLPANAPARESELVAQRGTRAVGDGKTRGERHAYDAGGRLVASTDVVGNAEHHEYDVFGASTRWIDRNGCDWRYVYDRAGRKISETGPLLPFNLSGEALDTPAPQRRLETQFAYDAFGNLVRRTEAANFPGDSSATDYQFDTLGRPTGTLFNGYYDPPSGTVLRQAAPNRFRPEASIVYDVVGNAVRIGTRTGPDQFQLSYRTYDCQGQIVYEVNALNNVTGHTCNAFGDKATVTRYSVTIHGTPANGLYWTTGEIAPQLNWGHDENGNLLEDVYARTIRLDYDKLGRKAVVTQPAATYYSTHMPGDASQANDFRPNPASVPSTQDAAATRFDYDAFGSVVRQRVRANVIVEWQDTTYTYDAMGRRTQMVDAAGSVTGSGYDIAGNLVRQEELTSLGDGSDRITEFIFDLLDRQVRVDRYGLRYTDAAGVEHGVATWTWANGGEWLDPDADVATTVRLATYDAVGRALTVTDAAGNLTSTRYDALGRVLEIVAPARLLAPVAANGEDGVDPFRNQITDALVTTMSLDAFGRPVRQVRATTHGEDAREIRQAYDAAGNLVSTTDALGNVKMRACDPAGRVIRETQAIHADLGPLGINTEGLERRYVYDALGQLTDTLDVYLDGTDRLQSGKSALYNAFGEVAEERRKWGPADQAPESLTTARIAWHHYDNAGHIFEQVGADGLTLFFYNLLGQVTRQEKRGNSGGIYRITELQYDILGRATMIRRPLFDADITPETGTITRPVTPYAVRTFDRWGNVRGTQEGGYEFVNGQPSYAPNRIFRSYLFDDNNQVILESLGTFGYVNDAGLSRNTQISRRSGRNLLGNVVIEADEAREPQTDALLSTRIRKKQYDAVGTLIAEIDATNRKLEYAANIHGERLGTRNPRGTVLFDRRDSNGNIRFHGILRTQSPAGAGEYNSFAGTGTIARTYLNAYLHDQANRRCASKIFTEAANAPWSYTWFDARNLGTQQRDTMGVVTHYGFDPFGNKALEIDGAGVRKQWIAATGDYAVGRIDSYYQPNATALSEYGHYVYNDFGEVKLHAYGNTNISYDRHKNGLVAQVTNLVDVTQPNKKEITTYRYDPRSQMTAESRIYPTSLQTIIVSYDNQGRLSRIEDQNKSPAGPICDVHYAYDEWSNVRRIQSNYTQTAVEGPLASDSWFTYDAAGRMTVSNGMLANGRITPKVRTPASVALGYDVVGRRSQATQYEFPNSASIGPRGSPRFIRHWDTMRDERYSYNDLGHLVTIDQRLRSVNIVRFDISGPGEPANEPDENGPWQPLSQRTANLRGDVLTDQQWTYVMGTPNNFVFRTPSRLGTTTTVYRADGKVDWTKYDAVAANGNTHTQNAYNAQTGLIDSYQFNAFRSNGQPFNAWFEYRYAFHNGDRVIRSVGDGTLDTTKSYDTAGRLSYERINLQKPNGDGTDRYEERYYTYDAQGRIIFKDSRLRLSVGSSSTVPLPVPSTGVQTYVYAGARTVATVGADRLSGSTKFDFAYTQMTEAAANGPSYYVVQAGDTVIGIAESNYGDGSLWYVIADANGVVDDPSEPLPSTEVGKAYEIPATVGYSRNANTYAPYDFAAIIGNDRPIAIPPPPPPHYSDIEQLLVAAASITVQIVTTAGLSALGVPLPVSAGIGAGLSNLAGQATSWELGMRSPGQDAIDWDGVGLAAMGGFVVSMTGPLSIVSREVWDQAQGGFAGWVSGGSANWSGIGGSLFNIGFNALGPTLGGPTKGPFSFSLAGLINSAYNPRTGWAIQGSGRSPVVGAFEYAYDAVANGLANIGYQWIQEQLAPPTPASQPARPRSVDAKGPISQEQIDLWDKIDREYTAELDRAALAAANEQTDAASRERMGWQIRLGLLQDQIDHLGEFDDRSIIAAALQNANAERVQLEQEQALAQARADERSARLRANQARLEAQIAAQQARGPDPALVEYLRGIDEINEDHVKGLYADGTYTRVSEGVNYDGLKFETRSGIYDASGALTFKNDEMDDIVGMYRKLVAQQPADGPMLVGNEVIVIHDVVTPAEQSRRLGLDDVQNFSAFSRTYQWQNKTTKGVEKAFLDYHQKQSERIVEDWRRIDNASGAVNLIVGTGLTAPLAGFDPFLIFGPMLVGAGAEKIAKFAGYDDVFAGGVGYIASVASGFLMPSVGSLGLGRAESEIQKLLNAERAARWDMNAARMAEQGLELEMSRGIDLGNGVTLYKRMPERALAAKPAGVFPERPLLEAPAAPPVAPPAPAPMLPAGTGGLAAVAGRDYYPPASIAEPVPYETTGPYPGDAMQIGGREPVSALTPTISSGGGFGGFGGGGGGGGQLVPGGGRPAAMYNGRLITTYQGRGRLGAYYQSSGESPSIFEDPAFEGGSLLFYKEPGAFYPFLGIQEQGNIFANRGWFIKGFTRGPENRHVLQWNIPRNHALQGEIFAEPVILNQPEQVNQWLQSQGYQPWTNVMDHLGFYPDVAF